MKNSDDDPGAGEMPARKYFGFAESGTAAGFNQAPFYCGLEDVAATFHEKLKQFGRKRLPTLTGDHKEAVAAALADLQPAFDILVADRSPPAIARYLVVSGIILTAGPWEESGNFLRDFRDRTKAAREARRVESVREIIERHARRLWGDKTSFKGNRHGTAVKIRKPVMDEIRRLDKVPTGWQQPADESDPKSVAREIDRIRRHVPTA